MPSDDLLLNVRQIGNFAPVGSAAPADLVLLQRGGLGGPFVSISPAALVSTALAQGGNLWVGGAVEALAFSGGSSTFANAAIGLLTATKLSARELCASIATVGGIPIATQADIEAIAAGVVLSFNGRRGDVSLWIDDIICAGGAPIFSPRFTGSPRAANPPPDSNSSRLATTYWVNAAILSAITGGELSLVSSFNGRIGDVVLTEEDILAAGGAAIFDNPTFTGVPIAPTPGQGTNTDQIATTAFVNAAIAGITRFAPIDSPSFTGYASAPTAPPGSSTGQIATTAFVMAAVVSATSGVISFNARSGAVTLFATDIVDAGGAILASPAFTGQPTGPTAAPGTANTQLATTAFVTNAVGGGGVLTFNGRAGAITLLSADITGAGGATLASPAFSGSPTAPTAAPSTSSTAIATTAFVMAAIAASVTSFNGRFGAITLTANDVSAAGGAVLASPAFTGTPTGPTAATGTNSAQLATTAYVLAAMGAAGGVDSFNGRAGTVTLTSTDVISAGGAVLASPAFTGNPTAPTAAPGDSDTSIATTAFVAAALVGLPYLPIAGGALTGNLSIASAATVNLNLIKSASGQQSVVSGSTGAGGTRWQMALGDTTAESGSNAGSNFLISRFSDAGAALGPALTINRANGIATFASGIVGTTASFSGTIANAVNGLFYWNSSLGTVVQNVNVNTYTQLDNGGNFAYVGGTGQAIKTGGGAWTAASDERIKTVEGDYEVGLAEVLGMHPVEFTYRGNDSATEGGPSPNAFAAERGTVFVGFIAQELEELCPGMVTKSAGYIDGQPVDDLRNIDVSNLVYALVNAVKTLAARVAALEGGSS